MREEKIHRRLNWKLYGPASCYSRTGRRVRRARLFAEGENRGVKLLIGVGVFLALLYWLFRLLYGP